VTPACHLKGILLRDFVKLILVVYDVLPEIDRTGRMFQHLIKLSRGHLFDLRSTVGVEQQDCRNEKQDEGEPDVVNRLLAPARSAFPPTPGQVPFFFDLEYFSIHDFSYMQILCHCHFRQNPPEL